jgi:DNA-nicking Smr family endonuclease
VSWLSRICVACGHGGTDTILKRFTRNNLKQRTQI